MERCLNLKNSIYDELKFRMTELKYACDMLRDECILVYSDANSSEEDRKKAKDTYIEISNKFVESELLVLDTIRKIES